MGIAEPQNQAIDLPRRARAWGAWLAAALLLGLFVWQTALPASQQKSYAFSVYYTAARLTLQGQAGVQFCSTWLFEQQRALGFGQWADYFCPNPPTTALLLAPVAWLPPPLAQAAWVLGDLLMIAAIVGLGWLMLGAAPGLARPPAAWYALLAAGLIAALRPLHADLHAVQVYTLLALLYALWLYGYSSGRSWLCGAALAALALAKLAGWPLWLLLLALRRWRALAWALGLGGAAWLATLPLFGLAFWRLYLLGQAPALASDPLYAAPAFQTLISLLKQCFLYDPRWSPRPLLDAPWLASGLWWVLAALLLAPTLARARRMPPAAAGPALALLCLVVPLQPAGEEYHYALLLIVLLLVLGTAAVRRPGWPAGLAIGLALLLLALPAYFVDTPRWQGWPWALLAYPRMDGALLLWGVVLFGGDAARDGVVQP